MKTINTVFNNTYQNSLSKLFKNINMKKLEVYKNHNIWDKENCICVNKVEDGEDYLFYVGLDDSKNSGGRKFYEDANNVETAKKYIDWKTKN